MVPFVAATTLPGSPLALGGRAWAPYGRLPARDWAVLFAFATLCMAFAAAAQVATVRRLGPAFTASLQPLRLVSTLVGSWAVLGEPVAGAYEWAGVALVLVTITAYLGYKLTRAERARRRWRWAIARVAALRRARAARVSKACDLADDRALLGSSACDAAAVTAPPLLPALAVDPLGRAPALKVVG